MLDRAGVFLLIEQNFQIKVIQLILVEIVLKGFEQQRFRLLLMMMLRSDKAAA